MELTKELKPATEFDRNKFSVRNGYNKLYTEKELKRFFKKLIEEVRKENPHKYNPENVEDTLLHLGYIDAVKTFTKKLEEKK